MAQVPPATTCPGILPLHRGDSSSSALPPVTTGSISCETNGSYFTLELSELQGLEDDGHRGSRPMHIFRTKASYWGQWQGNARHGQGQQIWADGAKFIGQWKETLAEGLGQLVHPDGDVFVGQWQKNVAE